MRFVSTCLAPSWAARFGIPAIIASVGGSVINMASNVALMGVAGLDCYTAAKGGIAVVTRSMAV
jgi:NAD(P)-dependent dehydrogenase (short-subunit alcohol dehydrogenase family)